MKIELYEFDDCFDISLEAETVEEAARIIRMGMNSKKDLNYVIASAFDDQTIFGSISIGKRKRGHSEVPKQR